MSTGFIVGMIFLAVFGGYVLTSLLLLRFPTLVREKKKLRFLCRHISHRGGAAEELENTMAAFRHAVAVGTDMLEIDCHVTKDGQVVVSHDNNLQRVTGQPVLISETDYKDIPQLMPSLRLDFMQSYITHKGSDRKIALLRDLFENFPNIPINIDIKINSDQLIHKVSDLVREYDRESITVWGNRSSIITDKCYAANPNMPLLFSMRRVLVLLGLFYSGLLPFVPIKESAFEIPMPSIMLKATGEMQIGLAFRILIRLADFLLLNKGLFAHLRRRGIQTYLWVLNDEEDFERAFRYGATGVMTDFPTKLKTFLDKRDCAKAESSATNIPMSKMKPSGETDNLVESPTEGITEPQIAESSDM